MHLGISKVSRQTEGPCAHFELCLGGSGWQGTRYSLVYEQEVMCVLLLVPFTEESKTQTSRSLTGI